MIVLCLVFPATICVITRKIDYLWDSSSSIPSAYQCSRNSYYLSAKTNPTLPYTWTRSNSSHRFCNPYPRNTAVISLINHAKYYNQCCGAATFLDGSGSRSPRFRSRLRLRPSWIGSGSRKKKRWRQAAPAADTITFVILNSKKVHQ